MDGLVVVMLGVLMSVVFCGVVWLVVDGPFWFVVLWWIGGDVVVGVWGLVCVVVAAENPDLWWLVVDVFGVCEMGDWVVWPCV